MKKQTTKQTHTVSDSKHLSGEISCSSCGAHYDINLLKCPYCGELNYKQAEKEYMQDLNETKSNLKDLANAPFISTILLFRSFLISYAIFTVVIIIIVTTTIQGDKASQAAKNRNAKNDYLEAVSIYEQYDQLYQVGKYKDLVELNQTSKNSFKSNYSHHRFIQLYSDILRLDTDLKYARNYKSENMYYLESLFRMEIQFLCLDSYDDLSDEDRVILSQAFSPYKETFDEFFTLSDQELDEIKEGIKANYGSTYFANEYMHLK